MTRRFRTTLFLVLVSIFFIAAPTVIFYSQGYRFDFETRRLTQIGAFFFDVHPSRAQIYIDGIRTGETSRFVGNSLSKNFLPRNYHVAIRKEGYISWEKNLEIFPRQVTEAKHITLFPTQILFDLVQEDVLAYWVAPNNRDVLLQRTDPRNGWSLVWWNTENNTEYLLFEPENIQNEIWNIEWAPNSNSFLLQIASQETIRGFVQTLDHGLLGNANSRADITQIATDTRTPLPFFDNKTKQVHFLPTGDSRLVFLSPSNNQSFILSLFNVQNLTLEQPIAKNVISFALQGEMFFWIDDTGNVWSKQSIQAPSIQISKKPFNLATEEFYQLHVFEQHIFLETEHELYQLQNNTHSLERILASPKEISISPDRTKLALSNGKELFILFLKDSLEQPTRQAGEKVLLTRLSQEISAVQWINSHYLLFSTRYNVQAAEIDTRDRVNIVELAEFSDLQFFWQPSQTILYIYSDNTLQVSEPFWL